jgi:ABC-type Fe3+-siderophore transport system permease subunit
MDFTQVIKTIAPTVAAALGGPLAGVAVSALGSIFGIEEPTQDKIAAAISNAQMTPAQVAQIKALELQYQNEERERQFKYVELQFKDVDSARAREAQVQDRTNRNLAYTIVGAFIALVGATLMGVTRVDSVLAGTLVGYLSAKCEQVLAYYFGSTRGSERKSELLAQAMPVK